MKKTFDGPMGLVEYELERTLYDTRRVIVGDSIVGILEATGTQKWYVGGPIHSPLFSCQATAAEYLLMWHALRERSECPYCDAGWEAGPVFVDEGGSSTVVWRCPKCRAMEEHIRWPPPEREEGE